MLRLHATFEKGPTVDVLLPPERVDEEILAMIATYGAKSRGSIVVTDDAGKLVNTLTIITDERKRKWM